MSVPPKKKKKMAKKKKPAAVTDEQAQAWLDALKITDVISPNFFTDTYLTQAASEFKNAAPFPHLRVSNFMDDMFLSKLREHLEELEYKQKHNDLYEFHQSDDLKGVNTPLVNKLKQVLYSEDFRNVLSKISGIPLFGLEKGVDLSAAVYQDTHHLLCHDDELEGRRIAYILYLVPQDWAAADGGALDLFNVNTAGEPSTVATSLVPAWNTFTFFEVSPVSYHQVSEVLVEKNRVSISGWFHGPPISRPTRSMDPEPALVTPQPGGNLELWVNREYRKAGAIKKVKKKFAEDSSLELHNFLMKPKYDELVEALSKAEWTQIGPANRRNYGVESKAEPGVIQDFKAFLVSQEFRGYLKEISGLELSNAYSEVRRLGRGDYTLAHSFDPENTKSGLDIYFNLIPPKVKWDAQFGATVHYLANDKDEELLTVEPNANTLSLVYRAPGGALRFLHYVNHHAPGALYQASATFRTPDDESSEEEGDEEADGKQEAEQTPDPQTATIHTSS